MSGRPEGKRLPPSAPAVSGLVRAGYEPVADAFAGVLSAAAADGAAFAAVVDGELVVDLWGGVADRGCGLPWREDTLVPIFSGTKGLTATCMLLLVERGLLELDAPVARWWPEFAAAGKEGVLVRDVLSHRAGLPGLLTPVTVEEATDDVRMAQLLAQQAPSVPPGGEPRYHALTYGWLCGELVRRADGRSVGRFLREEVAEPLGLDVWIGLPEELEPRVARIERADARDGIVVTRDVDEMAWSIWSNPPRFSGGELAANMRVWHAGEVPASNGIVSARSFARLYGCLARGGELDGVQLLAPETIERGRQPLAAGPDPYLGEMSWATGFQLQTAEMGLGPVADAFGHAGAGGSIHGAWPDLWTGFSYAPNLLASLEGEDLRSGLLLDTLHAAVLARA